MTDATSSTNAPLKAVTVGSALVDIITVIADEDVERITMHNATASFLLLEQGRKIDAEAISIHCGGGAVNVAVSLRRLGFDVAVLSKIGTDPNAHTVCDTLAEEGISADLLIATDRLSTGVTVMISSHDQNASVFTHRGANTLLTRAEIPADGIAGADLLYVASLSNESAGCFGDLLKCGHDAGVMVAANPGIRQLTTKRADFFRAVGCLDLLTVNRVEASALLPRLAGAQPRNRPLDLPTEGPDLARRGLQFEGLHMGLDRFAGELHELGPKFVVVTDGIDGAYLSAEGALYYCPALPTEAGGPAGAGDAFASTIAGELVSGADPDHAIRAATVNASSVVEHVDTHTGLLAREDLETRLAAAGATLAVARLS
ncbi:MAG: carbohydrate kinase family protein [Hyphomicrobiales bacterium]